MKPKLTPEQVENVEAIRKAEESPKLTPLTLKDVRYNDWGRLSLVLAQKVKELQDYVTELEDRVRVLESRNCQCYKCTDR